MADKLKIYADRKWLPSQCNHVIMLYPFWGDIPLAPSDPDAGRFDDYIKEGKNIFELVNTLDNCNIAVLPFEYSFEEGKKQIAANAASEAKTKGKKLIIFFNSDNIEKISVENSIILRTSFFKSTQSSNEFAFPGWSMDFMKNFPGKEFVLQKTPKAKISYCGYVDYSGEDKSDLLDKIKSYFFPLTNKNEEYGRYLRGKIIRQVLADKKLETDFVIRDGFWAQGIEDKLKARKEYIHNMFNSPYAVVTRGAGNFSYRLYEVMSCGKIPVFINTDCVLPYETIIDWKKQMVWVEASQISRISNIVSEFHESISESDFVSLQRQNRKIYEEYLSPVGFFSHFKFFMQ